MENFRNQFLRMKAGNDWNGITELLTQLTNIADTKGQNDISNGAYGWKMREAREAMNFDKAERLIGEMIAISGVEDNEHAQAETDAVTALAERLNSNESHTNGGRLV